MSVTTRVRGFIPKNTIARTQALLSTVKDILTEYAAYLPLIPRLRSFPGTRNR
jgi:hypothetical protein